MASGSCISKVRLQLDAVHRGAQTSQIVGRNIAQHERSHKLETSRQRENLGTIRGTDCPHIEKERCEKEVS